MNWLPEPWLGALIGGASTSLSIAVEGMPEQISASLGVFAEAGVVVRICAARVAMWSLRSALA